MKTALRHSILIAAVALATPSCATLGGLAGLVQAPRFSSADDRRAELRLTRGYGSTPAGATLRVFARVRNPNPFALTLSTVKGSLFLEGDEAADVDLPLGLELRSRDETVIPIDVTVPLEGIPALARTLARAVSGAPVGYRLDGTMGIDAGDFGQPTFGPLTLLEGEVTVR
ncbi:MAG TPA: LEA type 2 family protein [Vicinamibacteria bacterium]|nr:LEA type 2 family protein [Vicinamibacteria bacterium]